MLKVSIRTEDNRPVLFFYAQGELVCYDGCHNLASIEYMRRKTKPAPIDDKAKRLIVNFGPCQIVKRLKCDISES